MAIASTSPDILIIGSGMGGATLAAGLAGSGASVVILERGEQLPDEPATRDTRAIFMEGRLPAPGDLARRGGPAPSTPAITTMSAAIRSSTARSCCATATGLPPDPARGGRHARLAASPTRELEPWYARAEQLMQVRGAAGAGFRGAAALRALSPPAGARRGAHRPLARASEGGRAAAVLAAARRRYRALARPRPHAVGRLSRHPHRQVDAETASLARALAYPNVSLVTGTRALRLVMAPDGGRVEGVEVEQGGDAQGSAGGTVVLAAGAVNSAALLLASANERQSRWRRQPLRHRRAELHEPQFVGDARRRSAPAQQTPSTRRPSASTISTSRTAEAARRSATSSFSARSPRRS